jgi:hypothetical protein
MPIDFNRVPPRVEVPPPPQPSMIVWIVLLVLMIGAGADVKNAVNFGFSE